MEKTEVLLIAVTACAIEGKPFSAARLAQVSNVLTGKNDTANAVECRMREYKKRARELIAKIDGGECATALLETPKPKPRAKKEPKTPGSNGVKTGRVTKKTPSKKIKTEVAAEDDDILDEPMGDE